VPFLTFNGLSCAKLCHSAEEESRWASAAATRTATQLTLTFVWGSVSLYANTSIAPREKMIVAQLACATRVHKMLPPAASPRPYTFLNIVFPSPSCSSKSQSSPNRVARSIWSSRFRSSYSDSSTNSQVATQLKRENVEAWVESQESSYGLSGHP
jgi:hypothetical protein